MVKSLIFSQKHCPCCSCLFFATELSRLVDYHRCVALRRNIKREAAELPVNGEAGECCVAGRYTTYSGKNAKDTQGRVKEDSEKSLTSTLTPQGLLDQSLHGQRAGRLRRVHGTALGSRALTVIAERVSR